MTKDANIAAFVSLALTIGLCHQVTADDQFDPQQFISDKYVVILGSYKDFLKARGRAESISKSSKVRFSMYGRIFDPKRGLILPDDSPDSIYARSYVHRRYNTAASDSEAESEFISIERSEVYHGFAPGYYIIIIGIFDAPGEATKSVKQFSPTVPDAYSKKTRIYMGCIH